MATADIHVDCVDFEIMPGVWLEQVLELKATVECPGNQTEDWWLVEVEIVNQCHPNKRVVLDHNSGNKELFQKLERALMRYDESGFISDELMESYWSDGREYEKEIA